jgi:hypothetical protein
MGKIAKRFFPFFAFVELALNYSEAPRYLPLLFLMVLRIYKGFAIPAKSALTIPLSLSSVKTDFTLGMHHIVHGRS